MDYIHEHISCWITACFQCRSDFCSHYSTIGLSFRCSRWGPVNYRLRYFPSQTTQEGCARTAGSHWHTCEGHEARGRDLHSSRILYSSSPPSSSCHLLPLFIPGVKYEQTEKGLESSAKYEECAGRVLLFLFLVEGFFFSWCAHRLNSQHDWEEAAHAK